LHFVPRINSLPTLLYRPVLAHWPIWLSICRIVFLSSLISRHCPAHIPILDFIRFVSQCPFNGRHVVLQQTADPQSSTRLSSHPVYPTPSLLHLISTFRPFTLTISLGLHPLCLSSSPSLSISHISRSGLCRL